MCSIEMCDFKYVAFLQYREVEHLQEHFSNAHTLIGMQIHPFITVSSDRLKTQLYSKYDKYREEKYINTW